REYIQCSCLFFFFQAEDGIRDPLVTGVQTCALPILNTGPVLLGELKGGERRSIPRRLDLEAQLLGADDFVQHDIGGEQVQPGSRSEERRVGKECRSRWAAED